MLEEDFLEEKSKALSAGGPIDKMELKVTNMDIAGAFTSMSNHGGGGPALRSQKTRVIDDTEVDDEF